MGRKALGIFLILIGTVIVLFEVRGFMIYDYDHSKGIDSLIGQIGFDIVLTVLGIVLVITGIRLEKR